MCIRDRFGGEGRVCFLEQLDATVEQKGEAGEVTFAFAFHGAVLDQALAERGDMPLPPYIASRRDVDEQDRIDYQTMFAREDGSVAAPTAGLHFTESLIAALRERGIDLRRVTLHVGPGTFLPVKADDTSGHHMPPEDVYKRQTLYEVHGPYSFVRSRPFGNMGWSMGRLSVDS